MLTGQIPLDGLGELPVHGPLLDESALRGAMWFFGLKGGREPGDFRQALQRAFVLADDDNFLRLRLAFPADGFWMYALKYREEGPALAALTLRFMEADRD